MYISSVSVLSSEKGTATSCLDTAHQTVIDGGLTRDSWKVSGRSKPWILRTRFFSLLCNKKAHSSESTMHFEKILAFCNFWLNRRADRDLFLFSISDNCWLDCRLREKRLGFEVKGDKRLYGGLQQWPNISERSSWVWFQYPFDLVSFLSNWSLPHHFHHCDRGFHGPRNFDNKYRLYTSIEQLFDISYRIFFE